MIGTPLSRMIVPALLSAASLWAVPIQVYNTGLDNLGALLPAGSIDPYYALLVSSDPAFPGPSTFVSSIPASYVPNSSTSQWISPGRNNTQTDSYAVGLYTYETTFDLTGLNPATAVLTGKFAGDDMAAIFLNGANTGATTGPGGWVGFRPFSIASGFMAGVNRLDFVVDNNGGGPSGLRVELSGTAALTSTTGVPEPSTWLLFAIAIAFFTVTRFGKNRPQRS